MQIYLPIAEVSLNLFFLLGAGAVVGFLSGMFGVGGGFLMTPLLILCGVSPAVAVASQANQTVASSISSAMAHWYRRNVDVKLGIFLTVGGLIGAAFGMWLFGKFKERGQLDTIISLCYVVLLGSVGSLMLIESLYALLRPEQGQLRLSEQRQRLRPWVRRLPFCVRFDHAKLHISVLPIIAIGACVGSLTAIMGVGGGFILIPAMIYILHIPTNVCIGTSLFQILVVSSFVTCAHAIFYQSVDILLALIPMISGVASAQFGARLGLKLKNEQLRSLLACLVLFTGLRLAFDLIATPGEPFSLMIEKIRP